ncbi:MAG: subclass B3 metallo-beta-lactamase [Candidatus Acidiferrum sp.]
MANFAKRIAELAAKKPVNRLRTALISLMTLFTLAAPSHAQRLQPGWGQPFPPFRIAGNLYYVGDQDLGSYLIATHEGLILINSGIKEDVPIIHKDVEELGFHYSDIKILLISHAHYDHAEGSAMIVQETGAKYYVMDADVPTIESGGKDDFQYGKDRWAHFPVVQVDRVLHDGDKVELGGSVLVAHLTPGHTKGTTTWTMDVAEDNRTLHVVIVGSPNVNPGYKLVNNKEYPQIAADYQRGFEVLKSLPCDIFLGAHGSYFGLKEKYARWKAGDKDAFVDPAGYKAFVEQHEKKFQAALKLQQ